MLLLNFNDIVKMPTDEIYDLCNEVEVAIDHLNNQTTHLKDYLRQLTNELATRGD